MEEELSEELPLLQRHTHIHREPSIWAYLAIGSSDANTKSQTLAVIAVIANDTTITDISIDTLKQHP